MRSSPHTVIEPSWRGWKRQPGNRIPKRIEPWLRDEGSLTQRVINACDGEFKVHVLRQGWGFPYYSESMLLGMRRNSTAIVREVELMCNGRPWVFARSLIPATSLRGGARRLAHLGEKPLGAILFADPLVTRGETQVARLQPKHAMFASAMANAQESGDELWGRRTLYFFADYPILVNEVFLPGIC